MKGSKNMRTFRFGSKKKRMFAVLTLVIAGSVIGVAIAAWTTGGTGSGQASAALLIETAFARSRFKLPSTAPLLAGTSQPAPLLVCGEVTLTLAPELHALCPPSTVTAPSETELTWTLYGFELLTTAATSADAVG